MATTPASTARWVAGVDGCRDGWVVVLRDRHADKDKYLARVVRDFPAVLELPEIPVVIALDMPIGLLDIASRGGRVCEVLARQLLRKRRSSVFSAPSRGALTAFRECDDPYCHDRYKAVSAANRGDRMGPGISRQTFGIMPKIADVDGAMVEPSMQSIVREVHPGVWRTVSPS